MGFDVYNVSEKRLSLRLKRVENKYNICWCAAKKGLVRD